MSSLQHVLSHLTVSRAVAAGTVDPVSTGPLLREPLKTFSDNDNYCAHAVRAADHRFCLH